MAEERGAAPEGSPDLLMDILSLARQEGALEGEGLVAFAEALRERARLVLGERERRAEELQKENEWRRETGEALERENAWLCATTAGLERENAWLRATAAGLETRAESLARENEWRRDTTATLERQVETERTEAQAARQAHEQLLAHHSVVLRAVVAELAAVTGLPFYRSREARRRLVALAELLRKEGP